MRVWERRIRTEEKGSDWFCFYGEGKVDVPWMFKSQNGAGESLIYFSARGQLPHIHNPKSKNTLSISISTKEPLKLTAALVTAVERGTELLKLP